MARDAEERLHQSEEALSRHLLADLQRRQPLVGPPVALDLVGATLEHLRQEVPETDSVSWVIALISAIDSWVSALTARRRRPTR